MGLGFRRGSLRPTARGEWVLTPGGARKIIRGSKGENKAKFYSGRQRRPKICLFC